MLAHVLCIPLAAPPCVPLDPLPTLCTAPMDLVLVIDYSSSALAYQSEIRELASQFLSLFELSESGPRATVITFDSAPTNVVHWDTGSSYFSTDATAIESALVNFSDRASFGSSTRPDGAFEAAQAAFDADSRTFADDSVQAQRFVLLLTDSSGENNAATETAANVLKTNYGASRGLEPEKMLLPRSAPIGSGRLILHFVAAGARIFGLFWGDTTEVYGGPWLELFVVASQYVSDPNAPDDYDVDFSAMSHLIQVDSIASAIGRLNDVVAAACTDVHYVCTDSEACADELVVNVTGSGFVGADLRCRFSFSEGSPASIEATIEAGRTAGAIRCVAPSQAGRLGENAPGLTFEVDVSANRGNSYTIKASRAILLHTVHYAWT